MLCAVRSTAARSHHRRYNSGMTTVAILGTGVVGQSLASGFIRHGFSVVFGTGHPGKQAEWTDPTLAQVAVKSYAEAASEAGLAVLAVKGTVATEVVRAAADA